MRRGLPINGCCRDRIHSLANGQHRVVVGCVEISCRVRQPDGYDRPKRFCVRFDKIGRLKSQFNRRGKSAKKYQTIITTLAVDFDQQEI